MTNEITYKDVSNYYNDSYYKDEDEGRPIGHYKIYLTYLKISNSLAGSRILDVACGSCKLLSHARNLGLQCSGIDISDKVVALSKGKFPDFDLHCGIAEELPWESSHFDFITCLGALEHFLDQKKALSEMIRVSKPDAKFLIMVPNKDYPDFEGTDQQKIKETLLSLDEWRFMLESAGLNILEVYPDRWPMNWVPLPKSKPIKFIAGIIRRYKIWKLPLKKSYQFIFIADKKK